MSMNMNQLLVLPFNGLTVEALPVLEEDAQPIIIITVIKLGAMLDTAHVSANCRISLKSSCSFSLL